MKKIFGIAMTLVIVAVLLMGCGGKGSNTTTAPATSTTAKTTATTSTTASSGNGLTDLLGKAAGITNFYCEVTIISPEGTQTMKQWTRMGNPTKLRMGITVSDQTTIMIYDGQFYYMYDPASKIAYKISATSAEQYSSAADETASLNQYSPVLIGSETINGLDCAVYQYTVQGVTTKMWIWKQYGLPVKVVSGTTTMEYSNYSFAAIADSMFQMPSDAIMMTFPGMM